MKYRGSYEVEKVFHSLSKISNFNYDWIKDQLLLYICGKIRVGKSRVLHAIELKFPFSLINFDLVITALTDAIAENIGGSIIHISVAISVKNRHGKLDLISNSLIAQYIIIVEEISMVKLEMLSNMEKSLAKARDLLNSSKRVFGGLPIIIFIGNFYQFLHITSCFFWGKPQIDEDHNSKTLWLIFSLVIILTKQMRQ